MARIIYNVSWWSNGKELRKKRINDYVDYQQLINELKSDRVGFINIHPAISFETMSHTSMDHLYEDDAKILEGV